MEKAMRTIVLKLHNPSKSKKDIIDEAIFNYSKAFKFLYDNYKTEVNSSNLYSDKLNEFSIEPFKDSIIIDFKNSYNRILKYKENYDFKLRPIFFCRYATNRNYSILYDTDNNRYFAKIYLMNVKSKNRKRPADNYGREVSYINSDRESFIEKGKKRTYLVLPLSFGRWQEKFLKEAIDSPEMLKTARLYKRDKDYFLAINIEINTPAQIETTNYIGISRGIKNIVDYTVVDKDGAILLNSYEKCDTDNLTINKLHEIGNKLVRISRNYRCQIVMENLTQMGDRLNWEDEEGKKYWATMDRVNYNLLYSILKYKSQSLGLPPIIRVSSIGIFYTCPHCGTNSKTNRFSRDLLMCTSCGKTMSIDSAGSLNLSRMIIKYNNEKIKFYIQNTIEGVKFVNEDLNFEYCPKNPFDCSDEFRSEIEKTIKCFYDDINTEASKPTFKKKYSLIKKLQKNSIDGVIAATPWSK